MTPVLLALASLTPGDGGPGGETPRAPVVARFPGAWEGTTEGPTFGALPADLRGDMLRIFGRPGVVTVFYRVRIANERALTLVGGDGRAWPGLYRLEGARLLICTAAFPNVPPPDGIRADHLYELVTLHSAKPARKP
jgi:hypothetical protein